MVHVPQVLIILGLQSSVLLHYAIIVHIICRGGGRCVVGGARCVVDGALCVVGGALCVVGGATDLDWVELAGHRADALHRGDGRQVQRTHWSQTGVH